MSIGTQLNTRQNVINFLQFAAPAQDRVEEEKKWGPRLKGTAAALFLWDQSKEAETTYRRAESYHTEATKLKINIPGEVNLIYSNIEQIALKNRDIHHLLSDRARFYSLSGKVGVIGGVFLGVGFYNEIAWLKKASSLVIAFSIGYFILRLAYHRKDQQTIHKLYQDITNIKTNDFLDSLNQLPDADPAK